MVKSKLIQKIQHKFARNSIEEGVTYRQDAQNAERCINLFETDSIHE